MTELVKPEPTVFGPFDLIDRMFEDWPRTMPLRRPWLVTTDVVHDEMIPVEEYGDDEKFVVRAEIPGIDPEKDVEVTVSDGLLTIHGERHEEKKEDEKGYRRREFRYGSFTRNLRLPTGVKETDVKATYKDGVLEITVPTPKTSTTKVMVDKR
jgi:HSP20 family protein